jgi:serralysin
MGYFSHVATLGALSHPWGIADMEIGWFQNTPYLFAGSGADGGLLRLRLASDQVATEVQARAGTAASGSRNLADIDILRIDGQDWLLATGATEGARALRSLGAADGQMGGLSALGTTGGTVANWTQTTAFDIGGQPYIVAARWGEPGLQVFRIDSASALSRVQVLQDGPKTTLADVSALLTLDIGGSKVVVVGSGADGGLATYLPGAGGQLALADTLGAAFGLGMGGITALAGAHVLGESYVLAAGATTGTLTSFRVNPLGVLFEADHRTDDLTTRFGGVQDVATFGHQGRSFAVAGGADDGLALFEIGPGGRIYHLQSIAATVIGDQAQVFAAGQAAPGITQFSIDLARFGTLALAPAQGGTLAGTARDDHLEARGGATTLQGWGGNDRLVAGPGETTMFGGAGDDIFVFRPMGGAGGTDRIMDFGRGADRIDLSAYPMLYSPAGLTITPTADGARRISAPTCSSSVDALAGADAR